MGLIGLLGKIIKYQYKIKHLKTLDEIDDKEKISEIAEFYSKTKPVSIGSEIKKILMIFGK